MASISKRTTDAGGTKYDVRYRDPSGRQRKKTFSRRRDADRFARNVEVEKETGRYVDPAAGKITFGEYAERWLGERPSLRPRTREFYDGLLRNHLLPTFGGIELSKVAPALVREWWGRLNAGPLSVSSCAKAYRLLRTILSTAEQDELIPRNPCRITGAGVEKASERPVATAEQVFGLASAMPSRLGCAVLIMGFAGLRLGETLGLERRHVNALHRELIVEQQLQELSGGIIVLADPKTEAGRRRLHLPAPLLVAVQQHLDDQVEAEPSSRLFNTASGLPVRRGQWHRDWKKATSQVGDLPDGFRTHDLRHTANTMAASTGASTRELMARFGHASPVAALNYQHATRERDQAIADKVGDLMASGQR